MPRRRRHDPRIATTRIRFAGCVTQYLLAAIAERARPGCLSSAGYRTFAPLHDVVTSATPSAIGRSTLKAICKKCILLPLIAQSGLCTRQVIPPLTRARFAHGGKSGDFERVAAYAGEFVDGGR